MQRREIIAAAVCALAAVALGLISQAALAIERAEHPDRSIGACQWTATTARGVDTVQLTVKGICQEPTPGYSLTLTRVDSQGGDRSTLALVLTAVAPTGIEPHHVAATAVEYQQTFVLPKDLVPTKVTMSHGGAIDQIVVQ
ncbi:hypothetical protein [Methylocapsa acidiphila]|uniref:hypothetical protein n=1 Tax=Methylocapsa acidiphila TaxID=133552 RepID=UPI0004231052|nr:hypothetical protein [Methylocapsa acidiphila]